MGSHVHGRKLEQALVDIDHKYAFAFWSATLPYASYFSQISTSPARIYLDMLEYPA